MNRRSVALGALVVALGLASAFGMLARAPRYTPDGWHYGARMLRDRGVPEATAARRMNAFYRGTPVGRDPRYRALFGPAPPATFRSVGRIFAARVLYPALAAPLYPFFGVFALVVVSLLAYVAAGLAVYCAAGTVARAPLAALAAALFYAAPLMRVLARSALTDMLAIAAWAWIFVVLIAVPRRVGTGKVVTLLLFEAALALTRPLLYLPLGATLAGSWRTRGAVSRWYLTAATLTAGVTLCYVAASGFAGSPGLLDSIAWIYRRQLETGMISAGTPHGAWYAHAVMRTVLTTVLYGTRSVIPALAIVSLVAARDARIARLAAGAIVLGMAAIPLNPEAGDVERTVLAPLYPVFLLLIALVAERVARRARPAVAPAPLRRSASATTIAAIVSEAEK